MDCIWNTLDAIAINGNCKSFTANRRAILAETNALRGDKHSNADSHFGALWTSNPVGIAHFKVRISNDWFAQCIHSS